MGITARIFDEPMTSYVSYTSTVQYVFHRTLRITVSLRITTKKCKKSNVKCQFQGITLNEQVTLKNTIFGFFFFFIYFITFAYNTFARLLTLQQHNKSYIHYLQYNRVINTTYSTRQLLYPTYNKVSKMTVTFFILKIRKDASSLSLIF